MLTYFARRRSYVLGETVFAQLREEFLESVLALPLAEVERAGTGDLLSRTTNDMESLSRTVRFAVPEWLVAILQAVLTLGAMLLVSPLASVASLVSLPGAVLLDALLLALRHARLSPRAHELRRDVRLGRRNRRGRSHDRRPPPRTAPGHAHRRQRARVLLLRDVHAA